MKTTDYLKNPLLYYIIIVFCFFLIFTNSNDKNTIFNIQPLYSFQLPDYLLAIIDLLIIFTPYVFILALAVFFIARYTYLIKRIRFLSLLKVVVFAMVVLIFFIFLLSLINLQTPPPPPPPSGSGPTTTPSTYSEPTSQILNSGSNSEYFSLFFIVIAGFVILLFIVTSRSFIKNEEGVLSPKKRKKDYKRKFDPIKNDIIHKYLEISNYLEVRGINPDFSLTPIEFDGETQRKLKLREFETITYYYELARFSENEMSDQDYKEFQDNLDSIYEKVDMLDVEKIVKK